MQALSRTHNNLIPKWDISAVTYGDKNQNIFLGPTFMVTQEPRSKFLARVA